MEGRRPGHVYNLGEPAPPWIGAPCPWRLFTASLPEAQEPIPWPRLNQNGYGGSHCVGHRHCVPTMFSPALFNDVSRQYCQQRFSTMCPSIACQQRFNHVSDLGGGRSLESFVDGPLDHLWIICGWTPWHRLGRQRPAPRSALLCRSRVGSATTGAPPARHAFTQSFGKVIWPCGCSSLK